MYIGPVVRGRLPANAIEGGAVTEPEERGAQLVTLDGAIRSAQIQPPVLAPQLIDRTRLVRTLDAVLDVPTTVVCAPAGFGKSVLLSQWTAVLDLPVAWLSLGRGTNSLGGFLRYLCAAVRRVAPEALPTIDELAAAYQQPVASTVATYLVNELNDLSVPIVLVLDDYQAVTEPTIHDVVSALIEFPSPMVHLVLATRHDPPLPLEAARIKGLLVELRMSHLHFDREETRLAMAQQLRTGVDEAVVDVVFDTTEGWPVGVRMACEAVRDGGSPAAADMMDRRAQEYLVAQVLEGQSESMRRYFLAASLVEVFSASLCEAIVGPDVRQCLQGREFIETLMDENLFLVSSVDGSWYRFHHLFAELLSYWRDRNTDAPATAEARRRAAAWFEEHGLASQAIEQFALADDTADAVRVAGKLGVELVDTERWTALEHLLDGFPPEIAEREPVLLVLKAWLSAEGRSRLAEMAVALDSAEALLDGGAGVDWETEEQLRGSIAVLRGSYVDLVAGDLDRALERAREARHRFAGEPHRHATHAAVLEILVHAFAGRIGESCAIAESTLGDPDFVDLPWSPAAWGLSYVGWLQADLAMVDRYGAMLLADGELAGLVDSEGAGHYFLGISAYMQDQLVDAVGHLSEVVDRRFSLSSSAVVHAAIALALAQLAGGEPAAARMTADAMMRYLLETRSESLLPAAEGFVAELDLRLGNHLAALRWARRSRLQSDQLSFQFYEPATSIIEILLRVGDPADRARSGRLLDELLVESSGFHNPLRIKLLALEAVRRSGEGDDEGALGALGEAVRLSCTGGVVRSIADLGQPVVPLLHQVDVAGEQLLWVRRILDATTPPGPASAAQPPRGEIEGVVRAAPGQAALTDREADVLQLLALRYSNKEIARQLLISPATVKKHTVTLYGKLNVHTRREAVDKARALGHLA